MLAIILLFFLLQLLAMYSDVIHYSPWWQYSGWCSTKYSTCWPYTDCSANSQTEKLVAVVLLHVCKAVVVVQPCSIWLLSCDCCSTPHAGNAVVVCPIISWLFYSAVNAGKYSSQACYEQTDWRVISKFMWNIFLLFYFYCWEKHVCSSVPDPENKWFIGQPFPNATWSKRQTGNLILTKR